MRNLRRSPPLFKDDLAYSLGITNPLCASARSNEEALPIELQQLHGSRIDSICLATPHPQEVIVTQAKAEPYQSSKPLFKRRSKRLGLIKPSLGRLMYHY
jgi:hypothetical protein